MRVAKNVLFYYSKVEGVETIQIEQKSVLQVARD